ncbi:peptidase inhibitor family I36 protein [Streptomyces sp. NPDC057702]|uniref:peptidase inhibitor family I36 protein n=1 Tax=unclassified Streptomyces TaxID=2593676 RepID=UPI0036810529
MRTTTKRGTAARALTTLAAMGAVAALTTALTPASAQQPRTPHTGDGSAACAAGQLCLWERPGFTGQRHTHELSDTDIESCVPLPAGTRAQSLANRTGRPVTVYQSDECTETGEFETYPGKGSGTRLAQSPYQIRAIKIWER